MSEPDLLKAAAGCFGLLGVVTHITYECDPIATAVMRPVKVDVIRAIPPPPDMKHEDIPEPLRPKTPLSEEEKAEIQQEFERRANNDYYAEWFWFPYSHQVWVNTWSTDTDTVTDVVNYPSDLKATGQVLETMWLNGMQVLATVVHNIAQRIFGKTSGLTAYMATTVLCTLQTPLRHAQLANISQLP